MNVSTIQNNISRDSLMNRLLANITNLPFLHIYLRTEPSTVANILGSRHTIEVSRLLAIVRRGSCLLVCEPYERYY
jgi:hypothetical protein